MVPGRSSAAQAAASSWIDHDQVKLRLVHSGLVDRQDQTLGLEFRLLPSWHIYWRHPGAAGLAPSLDWRGSRNIAEVELDWPAPRRLSQDGLESFIYEDRVILPLRVRLVDPKRAAELRLVVSYGACSSICIPYQDSVALPLPGAGVATAAGIDRSDWLRLAKLPQKLTETQAAELSGLALRPSGEDGVELTLALSSAAATGVTDILVDAPEFPGYGLAPQFREARGATAVTIPLVGGDAADWKGRQLTLTLLRPPGQATVWQGSPPWHESAASPATAPMALVAMVLLALAGGVILNLMPCVLPVLSFKILGAVKLAGHERRTIRRQFLATAAGIVSSFLAL
ncbi:MAG: protein-disulfide reductase DsbD family protein, partial [Alphaproteobacteria bacterium]|nr:protein-disulfide reductase DsbD family protein [Alphaproteobacteria bacterium]